MSYVVHLSCYCFRPSLEDIAAHPFLARHTLPLSIPLNATHAAPEWTLNGYGEIVSTQHLNEKMAPTKPTNKPALPSGRRPLGQRDPNVNAMSNGPERLKKGKSERDVINVQGLVRSTMGSGSSGGSNNQEKPQTLSNPTASPFQIFDETKASRAASPAPGHQGPTHAFRPSSSPGTDDLAAQTNGLSIKEYGDRPGEGPRPDFGRAQSVVSAVSSNLGPAATAINTENDANILHQMLGNLETVMEITQTRKGTYQATSPRPVFRGGPNKWVTRYVDYTSKYGLGFLLNDGRYVADFTAQAMGLYGHLC